MQQQASKQQQLTACINIKQATLEDAAPVFCSSVSSRGRWRRACPAPAPSLSLANVQNKKSVNFKDLAAAAINLATNNLATNSN
jgi:hypothetical protein